MTYDYLQIKPYEEQQSIEDDHYMYILSFEKQRHIKISEKAKLIIECFNGERTVDDILDLLEKKELSISREDLCTFVDEILVSRDLLTGMEFKKVNSKRGFMWHRIPIIESDRIALVFKVTKVLYKKILAVLVLLSVAASIVICFRSLFTISAKDSTTTNSILIIIVTYLSLILHEIGHISASYHYGVKVGKIGIGMYLFSPVMYVDLTNVWRLPPKKRALIDIGGIYFQSIIIIPLTVAYICTKDINYCLMAFSIILLALSNLIPFIKLDGYWVLTDYFRLDNLSTKAFKIVKQSFTSKRYENSKQYIIASFVYVFSTGLVLGLGAFSAIMILINLDYINIKLQDIITAFSNGSIKLALAYVNNTFIYLLPIIFLFTILIKVIINVFKGITKYHKV